MLTSIRNIMKSALDFPSGQNILLNISGTIYDDLLGNEQSAGQFVCNILDGCLLYTSELPTIYSV